MIFSSLCSHGSQGLQLEQADGRLILTAQNHVYKDKESSTNCAESCGEITRPLQSNWRAMRTPNTNKTHLRTLGTLGTLLLARAPRPVPRAPQSNALQLVRLGPYHQLTDLTSTATTTTANLNKNQLVLRMKLFLKINRRGSRVVVCYTHTAWVMYFFVHSYAGF